MLTCIHENGPIVPLQVNPLCEMACKMQAHRSAMQAAQIAWSFSVRGVRDERLFDGLAARLAASMKTVRACPGYRSELFLPDSVSVTWYVLYVFVCDFVCTSCDCVCLCATWYVLSVTGVCLCATWYVLVVTECLYLAC